jgi:cell wall assembly regulator SMI1
VKTKSPVGRIRYRTDATAKFSVKAAWKRLARWSKAHLPQEGRPGNPPVTVEQIREFEATVGVRLPADVRQSYRLFNGQCPGPGIIYGLAVEELRNCLNSWKHWVKGWARNVQDGSDRDFNESCQSFPDGFVRPVYFNSKWIPLTYDGSGNHIAVDLDPGPKGVHGQVIKFGPDDHDHTVLALSWGQFLTDIADELEAGNFRIDMPDPECPDLKPDDPYAAHFHSIGMEWSRAKLGLRKLSAADQRIWRKTGRK